MCECVWGACLMKGNSTHPEPSCFQLVFKEMSQSDWHLSHPPCCVPLKVNQRQSCQLPFPHTHTHTAPEGASVRRGCTQNTPVRVMLALAGGSREASLEEG